MTKLSKGVQLVSTRWNHRNFSRGWFLKHFYSKLIFILNTCNKLFLPHSELQAATKLPSHTTEKNTLKLTILMKHFDCIIQLNLKIKKKKKKTTREIGKFLCGSKPYSPGLSFCFCPELKLYSLTWNNTLKLLTPVSWVWLNVLAVFLGRCYTEPYFAFTDVQLLRAP